MRALVIGGDRHGEWVELMDGTKVWLDIERATQHRIRKIHSNITEGASGKVTEAYVIHVAVHQDLVGPLEVQQVSAAMATVAMNAFARAHGDRQPILAEPPIAVPGESV